MKATTFHLALTLSTAIAAVLLAGHSARAQVEPRFRVLDLTELDFPPDPDIHGTVAINNWGQVAYTRLVNNEMHGWVYLPESAFGLAAATYDLSVEAGLGESAAWDLNMAGYVVGQFGGSLHGEGEAVAWTLGSTITSCALGFLESTNPPPDPWSVAYAVNDATPAVIIGDSSKTQLGNCGSSNWGFSVAFNGTCILPLLVDLPPADPNDDGAYARDISTPIDPLGIPLIVGFSWHQVLPINCLNGLACDPEKDPMRWISSAPAELNTLPADNGHEGRGTNDNANVVGFGFDAADPICLTRALFWDTALADPFNLGTLPPLPPAQETRAEAINNRDPLQVVGRNIETGRALLWEQDGQGGWDQVVKLNDEIDPDSGWILKAAHDANDQGCIVGWGKLEVQPGVFKDHAFLLFECPADMDGNAMVGITDLLALLAAWGPCPAPPDPCPADLNGDGDVGILDLLTLLTAWGPCCRVGITSPPQTVQDCINKFCCEPRNQLALEKCLCAVDPPSCQ